MSLLFASVLRRRSSSSRASSSRSSEMSVSATSNCPRLGSSFAISRAVLTALGAVALHHVRARENVARLVRRRILLQRQLHAAARRSSCRTLRARAPRPARARRARPSLLERAVDGDEGGGRVRLLQEQLRQLGQLLLAILREVIEHGGERRLSPPAADSSFRATVA